METFREFLINEEGFGGPPGGMGGDMGGGMPLGADPMGGMGGMGGAPMGGMDPMGGMGGGMGGAPGGGEQVPVKIKDADVWQVLDHLLNKKPLPKEEEQPQLGADQGQDPMGGMPPDPMGGDMDPMGGDPMGNQPMPGQMPGAPAPMGGGLMS